MKRIKIIIERNMDGFWGHAEGNEMIYGHGVTVQECKQAVLDYIELLKEELKDENRPDFLDEEFEIIYKFDIESLLAYYKGIINPVALHRLTGINQKQIHNYATGLNKPRKAQRKKIEKGLHDLAKELLDIEL